MEEEGATEVRLLFFGTFFHENTDLTADLVQLKQPVKITEIRVIPLGATVDLSTGSFQLGATNPSEFLVEFYYNDLEVPSKSTFELLKHFEFNDKTKIQLVCDPDEQIITDGLLVRGIYSTVTLAVYGYPVDEVKIKSMESEKKEEAEVSEPQSIGSPILPESPEKHEMKGPDNEAKGYVDTTDGHHIPTITTRINYNPLCAESENVEEKIDDDTDMEDVSVQSSDLSKLPLPVLPDMDTEEISDGEVFPSDDEDVSNDHQMKKQDIIELKNEDDEAKPKKSFIIDPLIEEVEPISSPPQLSDVDDSLVDEFQEPGFEEIISDEEIDFPEYDYGEWDENWAHKFNRTFNPFSDSFQIFPLKNVKPSHEAGVRRTPGDCCNMLASKCKKYSRDQFNSVSMEGWVEEMEKLLPFIPSALNALSSSSSEIAQICESAVKFWIEVGLNFDLAMSQPSLPYKTRHLKVGIKLVQCLTNVPAESPLNVNNVWRPQNQTEGRSSSIQNHLLDLVKKPYMSNGNKLLILRTLDSCVSSKIGFLNFTTKNENEKNCFQLLLESSMDSAFSTRMGFSLRSLLHKVKLMDGLAQLESFLKSLANDPVSLEISKDTMSILKVFDDLLQTAIHIDQYFSHPLRILPSKTVVELPSMESAGHNPRLSFVRMLKEMQFLQLSAVLVNVKQKELTTKVIGSIVDLLSILTEWEAGLFYLCNEAECTTILIKSLLMQDEDFSNSACLIAHCMEVMQCVDVLSCENFSNLTEDERDEDLQSLQTTLSFLSTSIGREAIVRTLTKGSNIVPFLRSIYSTSADERCRQMSQSEKTARRGYAVEILEFIIRSSDSLEFMERHGSAVLNLISSVSESKEGCDKLSNIQAFLKPTVNPKVFTLEGVDTLCDLIKTKKSDLLQSSRNVENNWGFPPEITTCFRILCELVCGPHNENDVSNSLMSQNDELLIRQLKYEINITKLHSLDMTSTMISILQKIVEEYDQPIVHSHVFVSARGDALLALILPLIKVLRKTIAQVIKVRKTNYRDTTAVPILLKLYNLMDFFSPSGLSYSKAQEIQQHIIGILLSYTIPAVKHGVETEEELNKSTWTAVVSEILKFTLEQPANFQAGLTLFSELLPLPLPIATKENLSEETSKEAIKLRRLWSAYTHGLSSQIQEMIEILCISTNNKLLSLLKRLCIQLADLSVSSCLVVCRGLMDAFIQSSDLEGENASPMKSLQGASSASLEDWVDTSKATDINHCSSYTARLLGFIGSLASNCAAIKCGILHVFKGSTKIDEKYCDILNSLCTILSVKTIPLTNSHTQAQDNIVTIFQSLCDLEINMLIPLFGKLAKSPDADFLISNSLPQKEHLSLMISAMLSYLNNIEGKCTTQVLEGVIRTLEIIAETEYGISTLKNYFEKNSELLYKTTMSILPNDVTNPDVFESMFPCMMSLIDFCKTVTTGRITSMGSYPPRTTFLSPKEFKQLLKPTENSDESANEDPDDQCLSPLQKLKAVFQLHLNQIQDNQTTFNNIEASDLESALLVIDQLLQKLEESLENDDPCKPKLDIKVMVPPESLAELFNIRPVYVLIDGIDETDNLPTFWLTSIPPAFEIDAENEETDLVRCDLEEISKTYLNGFDASQEIRNICKASDAKLDSSQTENKGNVSQSDFGMRAPMHSMMHPHRRSQFPLSMRGSGRGMFARGLSGPGRGLYDPFRSRPPNTSRPPSLHVDDFVALESSGQSGGQSRQDPFAGRGRGLGPRGGGGPPNIYSSDRRRIMSVPRPSAGGYYDRKHESLASQALRPVRGGRIYSTPNSDRWTADSRPSGMASHPIDQSSYRSSSTGPTRSSSTSSPRSHSNQPYPPPRSNVYRDRPSPSSSNGRFKERPNKTFNR